ncbi:MAG: hypothetical protein ACI92E_002166 [Oceanicoccus sp.]|jgi:hypothetical protein
MKNTTFYSGYRYPAHVISYAQWCNNRVGPYILRSLSKPFAGYNGVAHYFDKQCIAQGGGQQPPFKELKNQIYSGSNQFVEEMKCKLNPEQSLNA